jgi:hypothetical protein
MWFERSYVSDRGLVIPGSPKRRCATSLLTVEGLVVQKSDVEAVLSWDTFSSDWFLASFPTTQWNQTAASAPNPRHPVIGAAAYTSHAATEAVIPVLLAIAVGRRPLPIGDPLKHVFKLGPVVPLHKPRPYLFGHYRCDTTVGYLCHLLHTRPDLRSRLGVAARCERLRSDVLRSPLAPVVDHLGVRSRSIEIRNAVRAAGMTHPLGGRPVAGEALPDEDVAIDTVMRWLSRSHSEQAKNVRLEEVRDVLRSDYYSVKPWPFAALTS